MNDKNEIIRLKITTDMMAVCINPQPSHVEMTREEYNRVCKEYGYTWQFVNARTIKYFKFEEQEWHYAEVR